MVTAAAPVRVRSSAGPLAVSFAALVVYASLSPFTGWQWPPGLAVSELLRLPWPGYLVRFDIVANFAGYLPLGALAYFAGVRNAAPPALALAAAALAPALLSYTLEVVQQFLPGRVPSLLDWVLNSAGGLAGALSAALLHRLGAVDRWQRVRDRWFIRRSAGALVLLLLWPVGLLFPAPVPLGVGQVGEQLREMVGAALEGTPWEDAAAVWLAGFTPVTEPLSPVAEGAAIVFGLLAPTLVAYAATPPGWWRRALLALGAGALGWSATTLSTALNFSPEHATAWLGPVTLPAFGVALVLALAFALIGRRLAAGLGLVVLTALVAVVAQAPSDPYYAESLAAWEQGRFIRFHGLARWVGWLWPYAAMVWLLLRLGARDKGQP